MRKGKIALKLSLNFAVALVAFSVIIGGIFLVLFRNYNLDIHKNELLNYAQSLSRALSSEESSGPGKGVTGYRLYLRFIVDVLDADVWIVDERMNLAAVGRGQGMMNGRFKLRDLPPNAGNLIAEVFLGKTAFSEGFSETLTQPTLTVGTPIMGENGKIKGAVLLHSPIQGTAAAVNKGLSILGASILLALVITALLSVVLSYSFTRPLYRMEAAALRLSQGDYSAQCGVSQDDEIGQLAGTIDILALRLEEASKESEKLEQLRRDFVANISHELRTPVTVIRGSLEALNEKVVTHPQKVEEYHSQMLKEARSLERLVGDLLDLSRLQNASFAMDMTSVNISDMLSDVMHSAYQLAKEKNIEIKEDVPDASLSLQGDYGRLRQMFLILMDNAIKFSPPNGLVDISVTEHQVSIRDRGPGIDEIQLPYIFDRFYKTLSQDNKEGTGLGLAIAKQIAERHNIVMTAENHPGGGAQFVCKLPQNQMP